MRAISRLFGFLATFAMLFFAANFAMTVSAQEATDTTVVFPQDAASASSYFTVPIDQVAAPLNLVAADPTVTGWVFGIGPNFTQSVTFTVRATSDNPICMDLPGDVPNGIEENADWGISFVGVSWSRFNVTGTITISVPKASLYGYRCGTAEVGTYDVLFGKPDPEAEASVLAKSEEMQKLIASLQDEVEELRAYRVWSQPFINAIPGSPRFVYTATVPVNTRSITVTAPQVATATVITVTGPAVTTAPEGAIPHPVEANCYAPSAKWAPAQDTDGSYAAGCGWVLPVGSSDEIALGSNELMQTPSGDIEGPKTLFTVIGPVTKWRK